MFRELKILHAPFVVGGNPSRLSKAEKKIGLHSVVLSFGSTVYEYDADVVVNPKSRFLVWFYRFLWGFFLIHKFDVIHYNFGSSIFPSRNASKTQSRWKLFLKQKVFNHFELIDLKYASLIGKKIFVTCQGDDVRLGEFCRKKFEIHFVNFVEEGYYTSETDKYKKDRIKVFEKFADEIFSLNPDLLYVLPKRAKFMPYAGVEMKEWTPCWPPKEDDFIPHIVHAPSNREVKGTKYILDAIDRLKAEGCVFKFTMIEGISNSEAKKIYTECHILIDQLLAGFYGALSVELMSLGKPVICYIREEDMLFLPHSMYEDMPIINASPNTIYDVLKEWVTVRRGELHERGKKSREYVERWHDPMKIARKVKKEYERV